MSTESRIKKILDQFGDPVENGVYHGKEKRYYAFKLTTHGDDYADDAPQHEKVLVQLHFFAPLNFNYVIRVRETKIALANGGFLWPETYDASDDESRHIVFETETIEEDFDNGANDD